MLDKLYRQVYHIITINKTDCEVKKMFVVFTAQHIPYLKTWDEVEADTIAYQIGGYYVESKAY